MSVMLNGSEYGAYAMYTPSPIPSQGFDPDDLLVTAIAEFPCVDTAVSWCERYFTLDVDKKPRLCVFRKSDKLCFQTWDLEGPSGLWFLSEETVEL